MTLVLPQGRPEGDAGTGRHPWIWLGVWLALGAGGCAIVRPHVEIVVEDPAGKPVPGASVSCASPSIQLPALETDRRGRAEVPRSTQLVQWCEVQKIGYRWSGLVQVPEDAGRLRITLQGLQPGEGESGSVGP